MAANRNWNCKLQGIGLLWGEVLHSIGPGSLTKNCFCLDGLKNKRKLQQRIFIEKWKTEYRWASNIHRFDIFIDVKHLPPQEDPTGLLESDQNCALMGSGQFSEAHRDYALFPVTSGGMAVGLGKSHFCLLWKQGVTLLCPYKASWGPGKCNSDWVWRLRNGSNPQFQYPWI